MALSCARGVLPEERGGWFVVCEGVEKREKEEVAMFDPQRHGSLVSDMTSDNVRGADLGKVQEGPKRGANPLKRVLNVAVTILCLRLGNGGFHDEKSQTLRSLSVARACRHTWCPFGTLGL